MDIIYPAKVDAYVIEIQLGPDDILPGEDKVFEVYLGAAPGTFLSPITYVNVTITDSDLLPGMHMHSKAIYLTPYLYDQRNLCAFACALRACM